MAYPGTFRLAQGEEYVECPYNRAHQVTNQRFLTHLDKCRTQYRKEMAVKGQSVEVVPCRFNWAHQFPKIEIQSHERRCQDQYSIVPTLAYHTHELPAKLAKEAAEKEAEKAAEKPKKSSKSRREPEPNPEDEGENWDLAATNDYKPGYCPQEKLDSKCYLYNPMGLSKSERKQFRLENRQRYQKDAMNEHLEQTGQAPVHVQAQSHGQRIQGQGQGQGRSSGSGSANTNGRYIPGLNYVDVQGEGQGRGRSSGSGSANTNGRYIPGLNYVDVKVKTEKPSEWDTETVGYATPRRADDFNIKTEPDSWADQQDEWETDTVARSPARMADVKEEVKSEPICYDWDED